MLNPDLKRLKAYPFEQLATLLSGVSPPSDLTAIPLSIGEPQHAPPPAVLDALHQHLGLIAKYPTTKGTLRLREAIADWANARFTSHMHPWIPTGRSFPSMARARRSLRWLKQPVTVTAPSAWS